MAINQALLDQVASSTERRVEVTVNRVTAGANNRPALYAGGGTYQPIGAEPLRPRGGNTGIQTTGAVAVGASVQDAQGIVNARPTRGSIREQVAAELFPTFQKVAQIVDEDPNVAGINESGDPDKLRPRGQVDFAIDVAATALYYWDSALEEWFPLGGSGGGFIIDTAPPDSTTPGGDGAGYVQIVLEDGTDRFTGITYYRQVIPEESIDRWIPVGHRSYGVGRPDIDPNTIPRGIQHFNETTGDIFSSNGSEWVRAPRIADYHSSFFSIPNDLILVDQGSYFCLFGVDANGSVKPVKAADPDDGPCSTPDEDNGREGETICGENLFFGPAVGTCNWQCTTFPDYEFC